MWPNVSFPVRARRALIASVTIVVALVSLAACVPKPTAAGFDRTVYVTALPQFQRWWEREQASLQRVSVATIQAWWRTQPARLDAPSTRRGTWDVSTDLCSFAPDTGPAFDFRLACVRHDFAWRNLKRLGLNTRARRLRANDQFLVDMRAHCATRSTISRSTCRTIAATYHRAVQLVS